MNIFLSRPLTALYVAGPFSMGYVDFYTFLIPLYALSLGFDASEIGTRTEVPAGTGDHDGPGVVGAMDRFGEVTHGLEVEGVAALGAIDGENGDVSPAL